MKEPVFKIAIITLALTLFNCKNETSQIDYKYADKPTSITCNGLNSELYQEALYAFEEDILNFYGKNRRNPNTKPSLPIAYSQFIRNATYNRVHYQSIVSPHTVKIFETLKKDNTLWDADNIKSHLNYKSPLIQCISNNIKDTNLKTTFNALLKANSMSPKLFGAPLSSKYSLAVRDKYLATYIAFDLYYAKLFNVDLSNVSPRTADSKVDFNKLPAPVDTNIEQKK